MAVNEQGHYGKYSGNARCCMGHPHTRVDRYNYKPTERDDAAHISYLKRDIIYDAHHGHDDEKMVADEKHISKLAGDMRYDKEHHGPGKFNAAAAAGEAIARGFNQYASSYKKDGDDDDNDPKGDGPGDFQGNLHAAQMKHSKSGEHLGMKQDAPAKMMEGPAKHCFGPAKYAYDSPSKRYCIK